MALTRPPDVELDPSKKATAILDYVLADPVDTDDVEKVELDTSNNAPITDEIQKAPIVDTTTSRKKSRVLFITTDLKVLEQGSVSEGYFKKMEDLFAEIHVLVLTEITSTKRETVRISQSIWMYSTHAKMFLTQPFAAMEIARSELEFGGSFRPDIIVALDPLESGLSGIYLARHYDRVLQVHVLEDYFLPEFKQKNSENKWKLYMARYVLKRAMSIRTSTTALKQKIELTLASKKANVEVLPRQYDLEALVTESKNEQKDNLFPQFLFTVLYIGELDHESTLFRAMDAARTILHAKSIGMVVVGDGVAKKEFQKRAELLGIKEQVLFLNDRSKINQYMRSANILICTDTSEASDDIVIKAAAIGLPILAAETPLRKDLFSDGVDAFLCQKEDTLTFSQKLVTFLNTNSLRIQFATAARYVVETSLNQDPASYKEAYKNSIESVFDPAD